MSRSRDLQVTRLSTLESIRKLAPEWGELWGRQAEATPFQSPDWLLPWIESFRPHDLWVLEVRQEGRLLGVAPLFEYESENKERTLAILGAGISDYLDVIVDRNHANEVVQAIFGFLANAEAGWNRVELLDLRKNSPLLSWSAGPDWQTQSADYDVCPRLVFRSSPDEPGQAIPSRQHRNLKTAKNRIRREGRVQITLADRTTLSEHLETLFRLHAARWRESRKPGVLANEVVKDFHRKAAPLLFESGMLRLYTLRLNQEPIAALYTLWRPDVVYLYLQGFDFAYAEYSPGMQIIAAVVEDALKHGRQAIDFLRGREAYKYGWGARDETTFRRILCRSKADEPAMREADPLRLAS